MIEKLKKWILGSVIMKKVIAKFAKHGAGVVVGLMSAPWFLAKVQPILDQIGVTINAGQLETGMVVILTGLFGSAWNFVEHRFF